MNKRSIITTILTIIILLLLSLIFYHVSNKKVSTNIDIDYPVFKNNKELQFCNKRIMYISKKR